MFNINFRLLLYSRTHVAKIKGENTYSKNDKINFSPRT